MKKLLLSIFIVCLLSGCAVFQSKRAEKIPEAPKLNSKQKEIIQEQAKVNVDLAEWIRVNGVKPGDEKAVILANGCKVILKYVGTPYEEVDGTDVKQARKITERAKEVAQDFAEDNARFDDTLDKARDKQFDTINTYWDWRKLFAGGIITWILVAVGGFVLCVVVPPTIPIITAIFQGIKLGFHGISLVARMGISGFINIIKAIEAFRDANKNTEIGKAFDSHMSKELDNKDKKHLDILKNHFDI